MTKWWSLKDQTQKDKFSDAVKSKLGTNFPKDWNTTADVIRSVAKEVLGKSSGRRKHNKETWWWNEKVQHAIKKKKDAKREMDLKRNDKTVATLKQANKEAKKAVAEAKTEALRDAYDELETKEGQKSLFRIAKRRDRASKDIQQAYQENER